MGRIFTKIPFNYSGSPKIRFDWVSREKQGPVTFPATLRRKVELGTNIYDDRIMISCENLDRSIIGLDISRGFIERLVFPVSSIKVNDLPAIPDSTYDFEDSKEYEHLSGTSGLDLKSICKEINPLCETKMQILKYTPYLKADLDAMTWDTWDDSDDLFTNNFFTSFNINQPFTLNHTWRCIAWIDWPEFMQDKYNFVGTGGSLLSSSNFKSYLGLFPTHYHNSSKSIKEEGDYVKFNDPYNGIESEPDAGWTTWPCLNALLYIDPHFSFRRMYEGGAMLTSNFPVGYFKEFLHPEIGSVWNYGTNEDPIWLADNYYDITEDVEITIEQPLSTLEYLGG